MSGSNIIVTLHVFDGHAGVGWAEHTWWQGSLDSIFTTATTAAAAAEYNDIYRCLLSGGEGRDDGRTWGVYVCVGAFLYILYC